MEDSKDESNIIDFETEKIKIRSFYESDIANAHKNIGTIETIADCLGFKIHTNLEETRAMVLSAIKEYEDGELFWAIENKEINEVIGFINISRISKKDKKCDMAFCINPKFFNSENLMEEGLKKVIKYILDEKGFNLIGSNFYDGNEKVVKFKTKVLENIGMKKEATLRERRINTKGEKENLIIYSIIKEEII